MAGKRVFICAAAEDAGYYGELVTALNAWEVSHSELGIVPNPVTSMPPSIESAIRECEVFLRICTTHTRQSNAVKLATDFFQQLLEKSQRRGPRQRRRLVNLILDPAYPLDDEEKKTLYIMAPGKSRPLWLEELAVSVGAATLTQQLSRRALFGMGAGAAVAVASAGVAGTVLVQQFQRKQPPPLPFQGAISGNPRFSFRLSDTKAASTYAQVFQDGATVYAQPDLAVNNSTQGSVLPDSSVYVLRAGNRKQRRIPVASEPALKDSNPVQSQLVAAANGTLFLYSNPSGVFAPIETSVMSAVSARDGTRLWKVTTALAGTPVLADGVVYCVLQDVTKADSTTIYYQVSLNAFRAKDGTRLWQNTDFSFDTVLTPTVVNNRLYIGSYLDQDHNVYCLDAKTGEPHWTYLTRGAVVAPPTVTNGMVYVGSQDGILYALDAQTGTLHWRFATSGGFRAAPLVVDGIVYVPCEDTYIYALDGRSGAMFWRAYAGANPSTDNLEIRGVSNPLAVYRNVLFATSYGGLYAFDIRDGSLRWRYIPIEEDVNTISPPVISDGFVLVGTSDNHVYAVNP
jgi:outer membrane protein assembly factor BamB